GRRAVWGDLIGGARRVRGADGSGRSGIRDVVDLQAVRLGDVDVTAGCGHAERLPRGVDAACDRRGGGVRHVDHVQGAVVEHRAGNVNTPASDGDPGRAAGEADSDADAR